jgi:hypothetical protein
LPRWHGAIPAIRRSGRWLTSHHAAMKRKFDAFAEYVAEADKQGSDGYPLYA